jgi:hypothetical protein
MLRTAAFGAAVAAAAGLILQNPSKTISVVAEQDTSRQTNLRPQTDEVFDATGVTYLSAPRDNPGLKRPLQLREAPDGSGISGATVLGQQTRDLHWDEMKRDYDGDGLRVEVGAVDEPVVVERFSIDNVMDLITVVSVNEPNARAVVRGGYGDYIRDDAIENDTGMRLDLEDLLIDGTFVFYSERAGRYGSLTSPPQPTNIERVAVKLEPMPYDTDMKGNSARAGSLVDGLGHSGLFKIQSGTGPINVKDSVFYVPQLSVNGPNSMHIPAGDHRDNVIVWGGDGAYPGELRDGWTVTRDLGVWENARSEWLERHRLDDRDAVRGSAP